MNKLLLLMLLLHCDAIGQTKWVCIWSEGLKAINHYKIPDGKLPINSLASMPFNGNFIVLVCNDTNSLASQSKTIKMNANRLGNQFFDFDGYYYNSTTKRTDKYYELPDGYWLGVVKNNKRIYCKWEKHVVNGTITGVTYQYDSNRNVIQYNEFESGYKNGFEINYLQNKVNSVLYFINDSLIEESVWNTKHKLKSKRVSNKFFKEWSENGILAHYDNYRNDSTIESKYWFDNGVLKECGNLKANYSKDSIWVYYYQDGGIEKLEDYRK